jgi:hypothetical protein
MGREKLILNVVATMETHSFCFVLNLFILSAHWMESNIFWGWDSPTQDNPGMFAASRCLHLSLHFFLPPFSFQLFPGDKAGFFLCPSEGKIRFTRDSVLSRFSSLHSRGNRDSSSKKVCRKWGYPGTTPQHVGVCLWTNQEIKKLGHGKS